MQGGAEKGRSSTAQYSVYVRGGEGGGANVALLKIENRELKTKQTTVQEHVQPV